METASKATCRRRSVMSLRTALHQSASNTVQGLCGSCFRPESLTTDNFSGAIGRGARCMYVFVLDGVTVAIEGLFQRHSRGSPAERGRRPGQQRLTPHGSSRWCLALTGI